VLDHRSANKDGHTITMTASATGKTEAQGLAEVCAVMRDCAKSANHAAEDINLIAVSKNFDAEAIRPVLMAGQRIFGENRVQEAQKKWPALKEEFTGVELHLIGPLQSNKVSDAVELFDAIHTVDRPKIARAISNELNNTQKRLRLFIQVNTGEEEQKAGVMPKDLDEFYALCRDELGLDITGLMCIPPKDEAAAVHFAFLAERAKSLGLSELSMGMSSDFEIAIEMGATHIRVGTAIFGTR